MQQHAHLAVRLKPGEYARGVVIVEQLAAKFKIEFSSERAIRSWICSDCVRR